MFSAILAQSAKHEEEIVVETNSPINRVSFFNV